MRNRKPPAFLIPVFLVAVIGLSLAGFNGCGGPPDQPLNELRSPSERYQALCTPAQNGQDQTYVSYPANEQGPTAYCTTPVCSPAGFETSQYVSKTVECVDVYQCQPTTLSSGIKAYAWSQISGCCSTVNWGCEPAGPALCGGSSDGGTHDGGGGGHTIQTFSPAVVSSSEDCDQFPDPYPGPGAGWLDAGLPD